jgi:hypothetical protein
VTDKAFNLLDLLFIHNAVYLLLKKQKLRLNAYKEEVNLFLILYEEGVMKKCLLLG